MIYLSLFHSAKATFEAISKTYSYLSPDMWPEVKLTKIPFQEFSDYLSKNQPKNQFTSTTGTE